MLSELALSSFIATLFSVMDPIGNLGGFADMTPDRPGAEARRSYLDRIPPSRVLRHFGRRAPRRGQHHRACDRPSHAVQQGGPQTLLRRGGGCQTADLDCCRSAGDPNHCWTQRNGGDSRCQLATSIGAGQNGDVSGHLCPSGCDQSAPPLRRTGPEAARPVWHWGDGTGARSDRDGHVYGRAEGAVAGV